jgi:ribokinase
MPHIVVVGSYNRDLNFALPHMPVAGETVIGANLAEGPGGKGSNQAIQAAGAGARVALLAALGADAAARDALALWRRSKIDIRGVAHKTKAATGSAAILVEAGGDNRIVVASGANALLSATDIRKAASFFKSARLVVGQLEVPIAATLAAFTLARQAGAATLLNSAPVSGPLPQRLLKCVDILVANEIEACALTGLASGTPPQTLVAALRRQAVRMAIVTAGAAGAWLAEGANAPVRVAAPPTKVVDTTGAGDAFVGAFAARFAANGDARLAACWGVAAGSLACQKRGAATSYARQAKIARLALRLPKFAA